MTTSGTGSSASGCAERASHIGPDSFDYLDEEGIREQVVATARRQVIAWQIREAMEKEGVSEAELARRMKSSRSLVRRLLDPENHSATLMTLSKAALALGRDLRIELVAPRRRPRRARPRTPSSRRTKSA